MNNTLVYSYDGTFEGFFSVVFYGFERKENPTIITQATQINQLFARKVEIYTELEKAERVQRAIIQKAGDTIFQLLWHVFLSEKNERELVLYNYCKLIFYSDGKELYNLNNSIVLQMMQIQKTVRREAHKLMGFVRFQKTTDGLFCSIIEPVCDVLPLLISHFCDRFKDQTWLIYDSKRNYGYYYNCTSIEKVTMNFSESIDKNGNIKHEFLDNQELFYQELWKKYHANVAIPQRKNLKLQMQLMPKRFWSYITEMKG
ncbi:MAG: TIGR03915 family putative DNA repair protein [Bacteroidales bacterium]